MKVNSVYTYTELKARLAEALGRPSIATSTLSRWMAHLGYSKGRAGVRRWWDLEDLLSLACFGRALEWGYGVRGAIDYTIDQIEKHRSQSNGIKYRESKVRDAGPGI